MRRLVLTILAGLLLVSEASAYIAKSNAQIDTLVAAGYGGLTSQRCLDLGNTVKATLPQNWNTLYANFQVNGTTAEKGFIATLFGPGEWNGQQSNGVPGFWDIVLSYANRTPQSSDVIAVVDPATHIPYQVPYGSFTLGGGLPSMAGHNGEYLTNNGTVASWGPVTGGGGGGGDMLSSNNLSDLANATTARTNLGLRIGTDVEAYNSGLAAIAGLTTTTFGRSLLTGVDGPAERNLLGASAGLWPVSLGGTGTATPSLVAGTNITISGTWPNQTINSTASGGGGGTGDASTNTSSSVDNEVVLFSGTGGKTLKRATSTGMVKLANGVQGTGSANVDFAKALEQGNGDANLTWAAPNTTVRQTAALTAGRNATFPSAGSYSAGTILTYTDNLTSSAVAFGITFAPASGQKINGTTGGTVSLIGGGTIRFETNGTDNWTQLDVASGGIGGPCAIVYGPSAGTTPTAMSVTGNTSKGQVLFTTGSAPTTSDIVFTATYSIAYPTGSTPRVIFGAGGASAANAINKVYATSETNTGFQMNVTANALTASTAYVWTYHVAY